MHNILLVFCFVFVSLFSVTSQKHSVTISQSVYWDEDFSFPNLPFDGDGHWEDGLPVYRFSIPLQDKVNASSVIVSFGSYTAITDNRFSLGQIKTFQDNCEFAVVTIRKQLYLEMEIIPLIEKNGSVERIEQFAFTINYQLNDDNLLKSSSVSNYTNSSVLASGSWLKVSVLESGVHKIPYSTLSSWGFSNPANVSVFGYGGQMVPAANSDWRPDDLPQISVWHSNNSIYFYANGPVSWNWNEQRNMFLHKLHPFEEKAYYFLTEGGYALKGVGDAVLQPLTANTTVTHFDDLKFHENEKINLIKSGRKWFGEEFSNIFGWEHSFSFPFNGRDVSKNVKVASAVAARSAVISTMSYQFTDQPSDFLSINVPSLQLSNYDGFYAQEGSGFSTGISDAENLIVKVKYSGTDASTTGWLDFITVNARSFLRLTGDQLRFRDVESVGENKISRFEISNTSAGNIVWDVTDILNVKNVSTSFNNGKLEFVSSTNVLKEYVVFNASSSLKLPSVVGFVENQNLHAVQESEYVIVVPQEFMAYAEQLSALHQTHSGITPYLVTPQQIYNEFSWGHKDPTAIRSFMRMLYVRAGDDKNKAPKYLLLFGSGFFDNKNEKSFIPTHQSLNSVHRTNSYVTDDYFGFLDIHEGVEDRFDRLDIGLGRFPVREVNGAKVAVDKVKAYLENQDTGGWRKRLTFFADDGDFSIHMRDADVQAKKMEKNYIEFDVNKIYLDNYRNTTSFTGKRSPDAEDAVNRAISEGTILFNYVGHGGITGLTSEQVITEASIERWTNIRKLPLFVTATCEFSRFDDAVTVSAGEKVFLNPRGGGIALLTTTRVVFSSLNAQLNNAFFDYVFVRDENGRKPSFGKILMNSKNNAGSSVNKLNFTLLGDPALRLPYPELHIRTTKINNKPLGETNDSLKALSRSSVSGEVVDSEGVLVSDYNGTVDVVIYDKPLNIKTIGNDGATPFEFTQFVNVLFKGKATVTNGAFDVEFVVPYDIRYNLGYGKISYYSISDSHGEAFGGFDEIVIGGFDLNAPDDIKGPDVNLYFNHKSFKAGDVTGFTPMLYAEVFDESGINTSGSGIGHDIILLINGDINQPIILNEYFQAKPDDFREGVVMYQLPQLPAGRHEVSLRIWDTYNNSTTVTSYFVIGDGKGLAVRDFRWYPNPATGSSTGYFSFELDEPNAALIINVEAISSDGRTVGKQRIESVADGNMFSPMPMSIRSVGINSPGIYFLRFHIQTNTGKETQVVEKILIRP